MLVEPVQSGRQRTAFDGVELPLTLATIVADNVNLRGIGPNFVEQWKADTHHYTRGQVIVSVDSILPVGALGIWAEIQVIGWVANQPDVLATLAVNTFTGPAIVALGASSARDFLSVTARQIIDGVPSNSKAGGGGLRASICARLYR